MLQLYWITFADKKDNVQFAQFCLSLSTPLEQCFDNFPDRLCWPGGIIKDHTVWLDGVIPPPKYISKNNMSLMKSKI